MYETTSLVKENKYKTNQKIN